MPEESIKIITPEEFKSIAEAKNIIINQISNNDLQLIIDNAINKIEGLSGLNIVKAQNKSEVKRCFSGNTLLLERDDLCEIDEIILDGKVLDSEEYPIYSPEGIIYFNKYHEANLLIVKYSIRVSKDYYDKNVAPLLEELLLCSLDTNPNKDYSNIKEGDLTVQFAGRKESPLDIIENKIRSLGNRPLVRMI